jgi:hypothetical protein
MPGVKLPVADLDLPVLLAKDLPIDTSAVAAMKPEEKASLKTDYRIIVKDNPALLHGIEVIPVIIEKRRAFAEKYPDKSEGVLAKIPALEEKYGLMVDEINSRREIAVLVASEEIG